MKPLLTTLVLSFFILPLFAFAQNPNSLVPVSPEGVIISPTDGLVSCEGSFCSACDVVVLANTGIKWLLTLSFLFFAILALRAGAKLITSQGNSGALQDAKQSFTNAFIGLIIILVAWIFVDTLLRQLLDGGTGDVNGYGPWSKVQCAEQRKSTVEAGLFESDEEFVPPVVAGVATPAGNAAAAGAGLTEAQARAQLTAAGIGIKPTAVLAGVRPHVIAEAINLKSACGCDLYVTDATGPGHGTKGVFTHINGFKLDFRSTGNPALVSYIKQKYKPAGTWSDGTPLYYNAAACATYAIESDHIDVVYLTGC